MRFSMGVLRTAFRGGRDAVIGKRAAKQEP